MQVYIYILTSLIYQFLYLRPFIYLKPPWTSRRTHCSLLTPHTALAPEPTAGGTTFPKHFPPLGARSTASYPYGLEQTTTNPHPSTPPNITLTPVTISTPIQPTEAFKTPLNDIIGVITYLTNSMSYGPKMVLLKLEKLRQKIIFYASTYQYALPHPIKYLLRTITDPIKFLIRNLQNHPYFLPTPLIHLDTDEHATDVTNHIESTNKLILHTASIKVPSISPAKYTDTTFTCPTTYTSHITSPLSAPSTYPSVFPPRLPPDFQFETPTWEYTSSPSDSS